MNDKPSMIRYRTVLQVACIATVALVMLPVGRLLFPFVSAELGRLPFEAIEAVGSAALGFGLYTMLA
jgi:hypothetical protein